MAYKEFTRCVKPESFVDLAANFNGWRRLGFTGVAEFILIAPLALFAGTLPVVIALVIQIIIFLDWWLNGRLICLGGADDNCLIGAVKIKRKPAPKKKGGDDDATMDVYLADGPITSKVGDLFRPKEEFFNAPQGDFLKPQASVTAIGRGYAEDDGHYDRFAALHCEFEGAGIRNILSWAKATLAFLLLALIVPPPFSYIVLALAFLISLLAILNNLLDLGPFDTNDFGNHLDVDPNMGELKPGHVVMLKGRWIYDSLHDGWNEIHAIHACQIIGKLGVVVNEKSSEGLTNEQIWGKVQITDAILDASGTVISEPEFIALDGANLKPAIKLWCSAVKDAENAEEGGSRDDPKNDWQIHPLVDGCSEPVVIL
ncbi:MAG: hypothetical protein IPP29_21460 [Bacteroidetes bacterium]|nr:hypothetical protein [Bacteroidota bacterium]